MGKEGIGGSTCIRMISAPASARAMAMAAPMPRVPPVTTAVLPSKENIDGKERGDAMLAIVFKTAGGVEGYRVCLVHPSALCRPR